ncbi:hypothetical protein ACFYE9_12475 [Rhizobium leguminosarum]|uniref:Uncharacterized protein n=2 Tax=Rhizobium leguminosarum TaxID=384 RepID=A0ACD5F6X5_RHILE|nr:hypothetical protein [Rhizobium leguminosarum]
MKDLQHRSRGPSTCKPRRPPGLTGDSGFRGENQPSDLFSNPPEGSAVPPLTRKDYTFTTDEAPALGVGIMMIGVGLTLSVVALLTVVFRDRIAYLMRTWPRLLGFVSRATGALAGLVLVAVAAVEIVNWLAFT